MRLLVHPFFDAETSSYCYVLAEPGSGVCAIIDPVLGFHPDSGAVDTRLADQIIEFVNANGLIVEWLLETHVHADHLSAGRYLKQAFVCAQIGVGEGVVALQERMAADLNLDIATDGRQFDRLFADGDKVCLGHTCGRVWSTPGHTPACISYVFEGLAFVGDTVFMPDFGSGRCDFPGGDPAVLFESAQRLLALPDDTQILTGHDYAPGGRTHQFACRVAEQRSRNIHFGDGSDRESFNGMRRERDADLALPRLMAAAVPYNLVAGTVAPGEILLHTAGLAA